MSGITRRQALRAFAAVSATGLAGFPTFARDAEFSLKYGNNLPLTHPLNIRAQEAADRIFAESKGRVEIKIFPNNQLGGDTDMLAQVRSGGIDFFTPSALVVATLVPVAAINAVGFAFADYKQVWGAMDGKLGAYVRDAMSKLRLHGLQGKFAQADAEVITSAQDCLAPLADPADNCDRVLPAFSSGQWAGTIPATLATVPSGDLLFMT